jgi:hypothetical protein
MGPLFDLAGEVLGLGLDVCYSFIDNCANFMFASKCMLSSGKVTVVWAGPCGKHDVFPAGLLELHCLRSST